MEHMTFIFHFKLNEKTHWGEIPLAAENDMEATGMVNKLVSGLHPMEYQAEANGQIIAKGRGPVNG